MLLADEVENYERAKLDPEPIVEGAAVDEYYVRIHSLLPPDRQQLRLLVPPETSWENVHDKLRVPIISYLLHLWH